MRFAPAYVAAALLFAACGGGGEGGGVPEAPAIDAIEPAFGPLSGGSRITISGEGFQIGGAAPNRVLIGGREAPLAAAVDDATLEVVVPPGVAPGSVDVVVFNDIGNVTAPSGFRYSDPPTITDVSPQELRYDEGGTVTVTGSGFLDENAGVLTVTIDGEPAVDVEVVSDTQLTFLGPPGGIFTRAEIVVENQRGVATTEESYTYGPGPQGGLLLWPKFNSGVYVLFFDPLTLELQRIPRKEPIHTQGFRTVVKNAAGTYLGIDHEDNKLYSIDLVEQTQTEVATPTTRIMRLARVASTFYALSKPAQSCCDTRSFGTFDISNGAFTPLGAGNIAATGRYGLAPDGAGTMFVAEFVTGAPGTENIKTINRATGAPGSPIALSTPSQITGMRFLGNTLYAVTRFGELITINPATGATDLVLSQQATQGQLQAIETVP
jgi:hypothetical protein